MTHWLFRLLLGGVFIYAGINKLRGLEEFSDSIAGFRMLPCMFINVTTLTFPVLEIVLGSLVLVPVSRILRLGALGLIILNILFIGVLLSAWIRDLNVNCGCFGLAFLPQTKWTIPIAIARDVVLLGLAIVLLRKAIKR